MSIAFDQDRYIESSKGILKLWLISLFPDYEVNLGIPDISDDTINVYDPVLYLEYNDSINKDIMSGYNTGRGKRHKRKILRFSVRILTTGENKGILQRDKVAQKIESESLKENVLSEMANKGLTRLETKYVNSYRVRENLHLARIEIYTLVNFYN